MKYKASPGSVIFDVANHIFLILLMVSMLYPFVLILSTSFSDFWEITKNQVKLLPKGPLQFLSYRILLDATSILRSYFNSIIYAVGVVAFTLIGTSMAAYVLEHKGLPFRKAMIIYVVLTMFLPSGMIATFLVVNAIGLVNTMWAVILPYSFGAWYILIMRANIRSTISQELKDACYIDGAGHMQIFFRVVLPLIKPILATIGLFAAVASWNNFMGPLIYLNDREKHPLTLILRRILIEEQQGGGGAIGKYSGGGMLHMEQDYGLQEHVGPGFFKSFKYAAIVITIWPIIVVYPFIQKYFVKGILVGSLKE